MRKIAKLLCAFALVGFAACTNDTTEDQVSMPDFAGGGSVKTLTLALDGQTRIELGEKTAEGKYPVYWQEGDVLRINEGKTSAITIHENKSVADFTFAVADADAYSVVYPYVEGLEAATEGCLPVKFAPVQNYTEGSFDAASFPMYGYTDGEGLSSAGLSYLGGILKFEIKGNGEVLTKVELTAAEGALSGAFDVNCATGEMTAQATASKSLVYQLPSEGLTLSETPVALYIAVPAGELGELSAFFCTTNAEVAMKAKLSCEGEKAIKAGVVREFKNVEFNDNAANTEGMMFEIDSEAALFEFADMCKAGTFSYAGATLTSSFPVTTEGFEPIENFTGLFEGNNNTIRELKVPLFGTTCGTIQNLKIYTQVELTEDLVYGAVARQLAVINGQQGCVKNCSLIEGSTIKVNRTAAVKAVYSNIVNLVGGIVGVSYGCNIINCTNYADFDVTSLGSHTSEFQSGVGGVVGAIVEDFSYLHSLDQEIEEGFVSVYGQLADSANHGTITVSADTGTTGAFRIGGVIGLVNAADISNCENTGDVLLKGAKGYQLNVGGVLGFASVSSVPFKEVVDCKNSGNVSVDDQTLFKRTIYIGGVVGYASTSNTDTGLKWTMRRCTNTGTVTSNATIDGYAHWAGGIVGCAMAHIADCVNGEEGKPEVAAVTIGGNMIAVNDGAKFGSAGIAAYANNVMNVTGCTNHAKISLTGMTGATQGVCVGGILAYSGHTGTESDISNLVNKGPIVVDFNVAQVAQVGGVFGYVRSPVSNVVNEGTVTLNYSNTIKQVYMGGLAGQTNNSCVLSQSENKGALTINAAQGAICNDNLLGGLVGLTGASLDAWIEGCTNSGSVTLNGAENMVAIRFFVGGLVGMHRQFFKPATNGNQVETVNKGTITLNNVNTTKTSSADIAGSITVGGAVAFGDYNVDITCLDNFRNEGDINITNSSAVNYIFAAGGVGYSDMPITGDVAQASTANTTYRTNKGNITISKCTAKRGYIAGICGQSLNSISGVVNSGALNIDITTSQNVFTAGCVSYSSTNDHAHSHLYNYPGGDITVNGKIYHLVAGGCIGRMETCTAVSDCHNYADKITCEFEQSAKTTNYIGGVVAHFNKTEVAGVSNVSSRADISIKHLDTDGLASYRIGGVIGDSQSTLVNATMSSEGSITIDGKLQYVLLGGVAGYLKTVTKGTTEIHNEGAKIWIKPTAEVLSSLNHPGDNHSLSASTIGGAVGTLTKVTGNADAKVTNITNAGEIVFEPMAGKLTVIGGVLGWAQHDHTGVANTGNITVDGTIAGDIYLGGAQGVNVDNESDALSGYTNSGDITCSVKGTPNVRMGGLIGYSVGVSRGTNTGDLLFNGDTEGLVYMGGACGGTGSSTQSSHINEGNITFDGKTGGKFAMGGIVGGYTMSYSTAAVNKGILTVTRNAEIGAEAFVGGVIGFLNAANDANITTISNQANIVFEGAVAGNTHIGGIIGSGTSRNATRTGDVITYTKCEVSGVVLGSTDKTPLIRYAGNTTGNLYFGTIVGLNDGTDNISTITNLGAGMMTGDVQGETFGSPDSAYGAVGDPSLVPAGVENAITDAQ